MERRIVLTGSNGLLGQKIIPLLLDRPHVEVLATARGENRNPDQSGYEYQAIDLTDSAAWEQLFEQFQPTEIIHAGAITQVDFCEDNRDLCDRVNITATAKLCELCHQYGTRMIYISTDFIFDGEEGPYDETAIPNPVNYYGESKLKAEQLIQESGIEHVILRTILLYGVSSEMSRSNIVLWVKSSLEANKAINVVDDQQRCPTLVEDLALATVTATMRKVSGVFHISGPDMMNMYELAQVVADFWKLDKSLITAIDSKSLNQRANRPPITGFILLRAQTELDYKPHSLVQGLSIVRTQLKLNG